uniref:Large ribosomal subunit protein uL10-like insertion domain-containing protein n=1 Tax=Gorilla gorilla gorilla TaxID=9595 RepID=A0A2I2Y1Q3_GORGO
MPREDRMTWKSNYFKIIQLLDDYPKCFIVGAAMWAPSRRSRSGHLENNPALEKLLRHIWGNVGFAFTKEDLTEIRDMLLASKVPAATCAGPIAPCEVTVPAQNTGLGPEKTSFFQALGITTKISRGTIEILSDVQLIKTGDKVGANKATLLNTPNISPSSFALVIQQASDNGSIYNPEVVCDVASVCLQTGYPPVASVPHSIITLALSVETNYTFPLAGKVKAFLADPSAFVAIASVAVATMPQLRLKPRKSWRSRMRIWDLFSLTNHQKTTNSASFIYKTRK